MLLESFITVSEKMKPRTPAMSWSRKITVREMQNWAGKKKMVTKLSKGLIHKSDPKKMWLLLITSSTYAEKQATGQKL